MCSASKGCSGECVWGQLVYKGPWEADGLIAESAVVDSQYGSWTTMDQTRMMPECQHPQSLCIELVQSAGATKSKWVVLKQHQGAEGDTSLVFDAICYRKESRVELIALRPVQGNGCATSVDIADLELACRAGNWAAIERCLKEQLVHRKVTIAH
eukprot:613363-Pelagomonas_calceolata.AAC.4